MQSKPAKEHFLDLALRPGAEGREDCQQGWHEMFARFIRTEGSTTLDVGAGLGLSKLRILNCTTQDPQPSQWIDVTQPLPAFADGSFDFVTAFDVIEHVIEDVDFLAHLLRIARCGVFITTPNLDVSKAGNGCHCREYSPHEFINLLMLGCQKRRKVVKNEWLAITFAGSGDGSEFARTGLAEKWDHNKPHQAVWLLKTVEP